MRVALDAHEVDHRDRARRAHAAEVVAGEVDEHHVLGALLDVLAQLLGEGGVLLGGRPAPPRPGDRVQDAVLAVDRDQCLRRRPDDVERDLGRQRAARLVRPPMVVLGHPDQVHVRTRVGRPQDAVHVERRRRARGRVALRQHDLEGVACPDVVLGRLDLLQVVLARGPGPHLDGRQRVVRRDADRQRGDQLLLHRVEPRDRVGPGIVDALVRVVVVDGVGDQQHRAVGMVEHGEVGGQQEADVGDAELVGVVVRHPLPLAHGVVREVADQAAGQRRQPRQRCRAQQVDRVAQRRDGAAAVVHPARSPPQPDRLAVALGEHRCAAHADEGVPRPVAPLLGGLEQERARPVTAQRLEESDGGDRRRRAGGAPPG